MNQKTFAIGILSISALILLLAQFVPVVPIAQADTIKDRDYALATAVSSAGGDIIYVTDNRNGFVATFVWDGAKRNLQVRAVYALADAFR